MPTSLDRLAHAYALRSELVFSWATRPLALVRENGRTTLILEDPGGEPLARLLGTPMNVGPFLRLAIGIAAAIGGLHRHGFVHKDLKPSNILIGCSDDQVRLTGFGLASCLLHERQANERLEALAGTLAYMAPEQTGRTKRSIDSRSDLYSLGIVFYQMLTGVLPFTASEEIEWVHCHIARRPLPPVERLQTIPTPLSAITMKLLAKAAENRYQTATGLERDLRRCLDDWEARGRIEDFPLGQYDKLRQLLIPEKLYGREREVESLFASFDRTVKGGAPELFLISGSPGIGKSAVVNELHKVLVPSRGLLAIGKSDQNKRDIPYAALAQAFQSLIQLLLSTSEAELAKWRNALRDALGPNGQLIVDIVPELVLLIGEQPPAPIISAQDARRRLQAVFRRVIAVFARPEHPLALFFDDLQWLDTATLDLLEDLLTQPDLRNLLLIGAYRDSEVDKAHSMVRKIDAIKKSGASVQEICLAPLSGSDLRQLISEALHCSPNRAVTLSQLVLEKTAGNPFFVIQFLSELTEEGLLAFDQNKGRWAWDLGRISAKGYTDNVVDLMVGKLRRLPHDKQKVLQKLACLGNAAELITLSALFRTSKEHIHAALAEAVSQGLIQRSAHSYRFVHDRVQEAAYLLIPEASRPALHVRIGRMLVKNTPRNRLEGAIFEIVNQLNRGAFLISSRDEREQLAKYNLIAGKRAKASAAYASALNYLLTGVALLGEGYWTRQHDLAFELELCRAECELLSGELAQADCRLSELVGRAATTVERAAVTCLHMELCVTLGDQSRGLLAALDCLQQLGIECSIHPTDDQARSAYEEVFSALGSRTIEQLVDLPLMKEPEAIATLEVLTAAASPAYVFDTNLSLYLICRAVTLSIVHGNSDGSCFAYVNLGLLVGSRFGDYNTAFRLGQLGYDLVHIRGLKRFEARTFLDFGTRVLPWLKPLETSREIVRQAVDRADTTSDSTFAALGRNAMVTISLFAGDPLPRVQQEVEDGLEFARNMQFRLLAEVLAIQLRLVLTLRGSTSGFGCFDGEDFDEAGIERRLVKNPHLAHLSCWYWVRKMQARFLAGDYAAAVEASLCAQPMLWASVTVFQTAEYHFYSALSRAAICQAVSENERPQHLAAIASHHRQLTVWAENCSRNFGNRVALVGAELARVEGRLLDAEQLYEEATRSAHTDGFVHNEALANELAGRFYADRGFERIARLFAQEAHQRYQRWGAEGKVRQLEKKHFPHRLAEPPPGLGGTIEAPVQQLDLGMVIKAARAISSEIVLERLVDTLMRIAIEQAGAERGLLLLMRGATPRIEAIAEMEEQQIVVRLCDDPLTETMLPASILNSVQRTGKSIVLDDAQIEGPFSSDPYIQLRRARSVLCLPLLSQAKIVGLFYLENNLAPAVFAPARLSALEVIASQAVVSLENARLYRDLEEREAKIRRLVNTNIIGIFIFTVEGRITEANDAFLQMIGYDRDDIVSGQLHWRDLTPWESADLNAGRRLGEWKKTGIVSPFEMECSRKDGGRVPVLIGVTAFDERLEQGVAFVVDLTERRRMEHERQESATALAHANRVATLGQLTASIVHEVKQPIGAITMDAEAGLRFLERSPPDLNEALESFRHIAECGYRAASVMDGLRALVKKASIHIARFDINAAIRDTVEIIRSEAMTKGVSLHADLTDQPLQVRGDRVQLQQVILNLILNAIEAMSAASCDRKELRIGATTAEPKHVVVTVSDSGPGLPPGSRERLFEAFFTTKPTGMGLGLAISKSIVESYGGQLWATNNKPRGAVFQFTVPSEKDEKAVSAPTFARL